MEIESLLIADLLPDPANVRTHNEKNLVAIAASLKRFGQQKPIVIRHDNIVLPGNGTYEAAKLLKWDSIDCVRTDLVSVEAVAYAIADNRTAELAEWDYQALSAIFQQDDLDVDWHELGWEGEYENIVSADWSPATEEVMPGEGKEANMASISVTHEQYASIQKSVNQYKVEHEGVTDGVALEAICGEWSAR